MTKKHFTALAEALRSTRPTRDPENGYDETACDQWNDDVRAITNACARFNPNFDRGRFVAATEA